MSEPETPIVPDPVEPVLFAKPKRSPRKKVVSEDGAVEAEMKPKKEPKPKKEKPATDLRSVFMRKLALITPESLYRPWMATKALRLVTSVGELEAWAARIMSDPSLYREVARTGEMMPAVAVDTETFGTGDTSGLDTRVVNGEIQADIAGLCLSADGIEGLYVPINHEDGHNIPREEVARIFQKISDACLLIFFNSKFDREIIRNTLGTNLRPYPYFEDVQIDHYLIDPKSDLEEDVASFEGAGLKALSERELGIHQVELNEIAKVKASYTNPETGKKSTRTILAPFSWIPTEIAVWYAAGDAITTYLLWEKKRDEARSMKYVHLIDHQLSDALAWVERQRPLVDVEALHKTTAWHNEKLMLYKGQLEEISGIKDFNPGSPKQLIKVLFGTLKFPVIKKSGKTQEPSTDADVLKELKKLRPGEPFLEALEKFREYAALHPSHLRYDKRDHSARMHFKQCTVAGGRLAAEGGKKDGSDGGFQLNPQAIVSVGGNLYVNARRLKLEELEDLGATFDPTQVEVKDIKDIDKSCFKEDKLLVTRVTHNHVARYCGEWWSLVEEDVVTMQDGTTIPLDKPGKVDANEVINLRCLFVAPPGYTYFTVDYSNIEMRVAANCSGEPKFINEFLYGSGDFHTLTATSVFPEFSNPKTSKQRKKELRSLAKIINFALLYGGTEHTIYENMSKEDPTITKEKAKAMVDTYWNSVPQFKAWAEDMMFKAKTTLTCKTASGRKIDFKSAMRTMHIYEPESVHYENYRNYWNLKRKVEDLERAGRKDAAKELNDKAWEFYKDKTTGVANVGDYKKFMSKIQRISVNAPLQGLAGDFMRSALCKIHQWAIRTGLGPILLVHSTVHDEVDFSVLNEYVPFVLPRLVRLMRLRDMHAKMGWSVPIECDCEYGKSWDVKEHLTGDDGHQAAGYTKVPGLEKYIPAMFDRETVKALSLALRSTDTESRESALAYLEANTHKRCHINIRTTDPKTPKLDVAEPREVLQKLIAILQLHEYWILDEQDEKDDESLFGYQTRMGLEVTAEPTQERPVVPQRRAAAPKAEEESTPTEGEPETDTIEVPVATLPEPVEEEEPVATEPAPSVQMVPRMVDGYPVIRDLTPEEVPQFKQALGFGGKLSVSFYTLSGELLQIPKVKYTDIPPEFLVLEEARVEEG